MTFFVIQVSPLPCGNSANAVHMSSQRNEVSQRCDLSTSLNDFLYLRNVPFQTELSIDEVYIIIFR